MEVVTVCAPVNIAVVKYWGKRDDELILPLNGSISVTLDSDVMCAKTSIATSQSFNSDKMWLNGIECHMSKRLERVLEEIRKRASACQSNISENWKVHICSENNFPTAAGLASSAAGLACLAFGLARLFGVEGDISDIARMGSGSACRSMYGGFVEWKVGEDEDGKDSVASQIADASHWPNMAVLILVVNAGKKHTSSTRGMNTSVKTSKLLEHRARELVPLTLKDMTAAILERDFHKFAELTMKDSNQMHACCLDTYPPIVYLTDTSREVVRLVHDLNDHFGSNKVAYTFDAGPNACLYLMDEDVPLVLSVIKHFFPPSSDADFVRGRPVRDVEIGRELLDSISVGIHPGTISHIISTKVGCGPKELPSQSCLLDQTTGLPLQMIRK